MIQRYRPHGEIAEFMQCRDPEVIISGPAETGKTLACCWMLHLMADKYPGAQLAMVRLTYKSMPGSVLQTFEKVIEGTGVVPFGGSRPDQYIYPNGSVIWLAGMDNPDKVLSSERDIIYVNQAEELSLEAWETLATRTTGRAGNMPYSQLIGDCNPAGEQHWILTRSTEDKLTRFDTTHHDNPTLYDPRTGELTERGERSMQTLRNLSGARYKRLYLGQWAAPEGIIYDVFDHEQHKVKAFEIPREWPRIVGIDPFGDCVVALWLALDPRSQVWNVYREYVAPFGVTTEGHVKAIHELSAQEPIFFYVGGGPSERQARADFTGYGVPLLAPAISAVWSQIDRVYAMLKNNQLVIHDTCPHLLSEITEYHRETKNGAVVDGTIADKAKFHVLDSLRYAVTGPEMPAEQSRIVYAPR